MSFQDFVPCQPTNYQIDIGKEKKRQQQEYNDDTYLNRHHLTYKIMTRFLHTENRIKPDFFYFQATTKKQTNEPVVRVVPRPYVEYPLTIRTNQPTSQPVMPRYHHVSTYYVYRQTSRTKSNQEPTTTKLHITATLYFPVYSFRYFSTSSLF